MKRNRRSKITPEIRARCEEVAALKRITPSYKELEIETGVNRNYLAKIIHDLVHAGSSPDDSGISIAET